MRLLAVYGVHACKDAQREEILSARLILDVASALARAFLEPTMLMKTKARTHQKKQAVVPLPRILPRNFLTPHVIKMIWFSCSNISILTRLTS